MASIASGNPSFIILQSPSIVGMQHEFNNSEHPRSLIFMVLLISSYSDNFSVCRTCIDTSDPWYFSWTIYWLCVTCDIELIPTYTSICIELKKGLDQLPGSVPVHVLSEPVKSFINERQHLAYHFLPRNRRELLQRYFWYLLPQLLWDNPGDTLSSNVYLYKQFLRLQNRIFILC